MSPKILVSRTLDGWTVTHVMESGIFSQLSNPRVCGKLTKKDAIAMARIAAGQRGLPVVVGD